MIERTLDNKSVKEFFFINAVLASLGSKITKWELNLFAVMFDHKHTYIRRDIIEIISEN